MRGLRDFLYEDSSGDTVAIIVIQVPYRVPGRMRTRQTCFATPHHLMSLWCGRGQIREAVVVLRRGRKYDEFFKTTGANAAKIALLIKAGQCIRPYFRASSRESGGSRDELGFESRQIHKTGGIFY